MSDLPPELQPDVEQHIGAGTQTWQDGLLNWTQQQLASGSKAVASQVMPEVEKILIRAALNKTGGRKNDAANLLGWGRNTLTRKIKEHAIE